MTTILKYFTVYALSSLKFVFGPTLGAAYGLPVVVTIILTALGMMTTVYLFTYLSIPLKKFAGKFRRRERKVFTKRNRRFVRIWVKYGLKGACLLTPVLLTPPGGAILVNLFDSDKKELLKWMWISAVGWSAIISIFFKYAHVYVVDFL